MTARVLIVDDIPSNVRLLRARLLADYYEIEVAGDGITALDLARSWQPDLILLDIMMPGMDGFECCRQLKDDFSTLHIPVVMVTASAQFHDREQAERASVNEFVAKPFDPEELLAKIDALTAGGQG